MKSFLISDFIEEASGFGSFPFILFLITFFYLIGETQLSLWLLIGMIVSFIIVFLIKLFYFKERPNKIAYNNLLEKLNAGSFPSLHSLRIIMISTLISYYYQSLYLGIFLGLISLFVMYTRIRLKKHYFMDVLFRGIFGAIEAFLIMYLIH